MKTVAQKIKNTQALLAYAGIKRVASGRDDSGYWAIYEHASGNDIEPIASRFWQKDNLYVEDYRELAWLVIMKVLRECTALEYESLMPAMQQMDYLPLSTWIQFMLDMIVQVLALGEEETSA